MKLPQNLQSIRFDRRAAFTQMEMLIVVAIIVALAGIGGFYLLGALSGGQKDAAKAQVKGALTQACQAYAIKHGNTFPDSLQQLLSKDEQGGGPYLESTDALLDPWGKQYQYDRSGTHNRGMKPDIWTVAPDGTQVGNWPAGQ